MEDKVRICWRTIVAPSLSLEGLEALRDAVAEDKTSLIQVHTTEPGLLEAPQCCPEGACAIAYAGWKAYGLTTVKELNDYFADVTNMNPRFNPFLTWFDWTAREEVLRELLPEIELAISERSQ